MKFPVFPATTLTSMVDQLTLARLSKLLREFRQSHGRDMSMTELKARGFDETLVDLLVRNRTLTKYQVVAKGGRKENRFKLAVDWRGLRC